MKMMQLTTNFNISEFRCKDGTDVPTEYQQNCLILAKQLQIIRNELSKEIGETVPIAILSGYRSENHNKKVGGAKNSQHLTASACDIRVKKDFMQHLYILINELIDTDVILAGGIKYYRDKNFIHYDIRGVKTKW